MPASDVHDLAAAAASSLPGDDSEEWRWIPGWEGYYEASTLGRIRSHRGPRDVPWRDGPRVLRPASNRWGHMHVVLRNKTSTLVHRLVALTFHGAPPSGKKQCRHLNGDPADNRPENLAWGTPKQNSEDMVRHGTRRRGEDHPGAKLTQEQVLAVYARRGESACVVADEHDLPQWAIHNIWRGRSWGWLTGA